ncbi:hypothetical protein [Streptomyces sp. I05A-00742]|uniref:hypothetical protein n=1 Tax=Streptomyces sp. I05A-00742 TaxID=2732853 RepID=UPI0014881E5B|nr:hypothetical protein [Streptomyces sp. I05A-00742]
MGTDIYGGIEVRDPCADEDWYEWPAWQRAMDLSPLYFGRDYASFASLFGVRDDIGWDPVAARRGLPPDVSSEMKEEFDKAVGTDPVVHSPTWVTWGELDRADLDAAPPGVRGVLLLRHDRSPALEIRYWITDHWPSGAVEKLGAPPSPRSPADTPFGEWRLGSTRLTYESFTRRDAVGPGTGWEHVFAVMKALAGRFGDEGVRLVVYFD